MTDETRMDRRKLLKAAGIVAVGTGAEAGRAVDQNTATVHKQANIPCEPDVLVVGGGPAGIGAALGAARAGVSTLLIEGCAFFGGVAAWSLGMPINLIRPDTKARSVIHELLLE